ncbi:MAG: NAD(+) synthase [Deltaproteobacteria bacterium]|nr:NAD(+) synthase [Deltaproteobacteria bacterium]
MIAKIDLLASFLEAKLRDFADVAVVGVSGGVDSAVVAAICTEALGQENVYLVSMPYDEIDRQTFNMLSAELAEKLRAHHLVIPIDEPTDAIVHKIEMGFERELLTKHELHQLTKGNIRARARMNVLYSIAGELITRFDERENCESTVISLKGKSSKRRVRVIGTSNASEELIGYDTKGGDALADLFIIGDLFKSEVYQLAQYYEVLPSIVAAPPSAGLYPGQTDHRELGYSYEELEPALCALYRVIDRGVKDEDINVALMEFAEVDSKVANFVIDRFRANAHKHRAAAVVKVRNTSLVKDIWLTS